ncbi:MAG: adenosylhomocysteinase [Omnitrophica WOR_2 bacterium RIFCSPHIGHO2_02_FULL_68_15]|nr:MAG: adenosylhomocysteinase [Omnitrophica WOR_2 bacterium RIFCSPHIGHO2_02_FULL_68_15]
MRCDVTNLKLSAAGVTRVEWAGRFMPVLALIRRRFAKEKPLAGVRLGACLHVTTETAQLALTLRAGGADVAICASNPLSTQDDVAAALATKYKFQVYARRGENRKTYYRHLNAVLDHRPHITMDDGADLVSLLHSTRKSQAGEVVGSTEETTTGVIRLRALESQRKLLFPVLAVNDSDTKHLFDNRYGTGQSTLDGILRATNILIAGSTVVVSGYGWCGRGVATRARGAGANVIVCEVHPVRALEAVMDGYRVMPILKAAPLGDLFVTVTGDINVIARAAFARMKDGAIVANSGHFNVELDLESLRRMATSVKPLRPDVEEYQLPGGKRIVVLAQGRLVNLSCAEGHPAAVMDMSFANQALAAEWMWGRRGKLARQVYTLPEHLDTQIARLKLKSLGVATDRLTPEQRRYLASWEVGT